MLVGEGPYFAKATQGREAEMGKSGGRSQKTEVRSQESEDKRRETEFF